MNAFPQITRYRTHALRLPQAEPAARRRALDRILAPLDEIAARSDHFFRKPLGRHADGSAVLPRYLHLGPQGGGDYVRLGIFAAIHGDEPEGALALTRFIADLERQPDLAKGYAIFIYPICNPTGFEDGTRHSRSGKDLNREFWRESTEPEVRWLQTEIWTHAFNGIVNLHSDDTSEGLYGFVNGEVLSEYLLEPALQSAEKHLPRNRRRRIDGFQAKRGIIYECYDGILRSVPGLSPAPFELTLETPQNAPLHRQVDAFNAALQTILVEYRYLTAVAQGI